MDNILNLPVDYKTMAQDKLAAEYEKISKSNRYVNAVKDAVYNTVWNFCEQNELFAEAVSKTVRTLEDVCSECLKDVKQSISDIDLYKEVVKNYFPNSNVSMQMNIEICGAMPTDDELNREIEKPEPSKPYEPKVLTEEEKEEQRLQAEQRRAEAEERKKEEAERKRIKAMEDKRKAEEEKGQITLFF